MPKQSRPDALSPIWTRRAITCQQTFAIVEADIRKLRHDPFELFTRMIQPCIWLLIFGQAMAKVRAIQPMDFPILIL